MRVYLYKYNNYYNRIYKKENTLSLYGTPVLVETGVMAFNKADGVRTQYTINTVPCADWVTEPDYAILTDDLDNIISRWFIIDMNYTRKGQYVLELYRDVLADFDGWDTAPAFIEKGTIQDITDPAIFNSENIEFNQIKREEVLLTDNSEVAWFVGYIAKNYTQGANIEISAKDAEPAIAQYDDWNAFEASNNYEIDEMYETPTDVTIHYNGRDSKDPLYLTAYKNDITNEFDGTTNLFGQLVQVGNTTYRIQKELISAYWPIVSGQHLTTAANFILGRFHSSYQGHVSGERFVVKAIEVGGVSALTLSVSEFGDKLKYTTPDEAFRLVAIPFSKDNTLDWYDKSTGTTTTLNVSETNHIATNLMTTLSTNCYDFQLLPYCPLRRAIIGPNTVSNRDLDANEYTIKNGVLLLFPKEAQGTFKIVPDTDTLDFGNSVENIKVKAMTTVHRLCSPNYASVYEFNAQKNMGVVQFDVDFAYRPVSPYIHINPDYKHMYGADYNDPRGLICQGDFSIPRATSQFEEYKVQNKYFQDIFNRQVENMEVNNSIARTQAIAQGVSGTFTGATGGGVAGNLINGLGTAGVGAAIGAGVSAVGAVGDYHILKKQQAEQMDYTKDMFGFNLKTIEARPNTVSNLQAFTPNNKIFPVLEYYDCTAEEREALINKLTYNGYTIGRIGKFADFTGGYIKGQLIRYEGAGNHETNAIYEELYKGVYT